MKNRVICGLSAALIYTNLIYIEGWNGVMTGLCVIAHILSLLAVTGLVNDIVSGKAFDCHSEFVKELKGEEGNENE